MNKLAVSEGGPVYLGGGPFVPVSWFSSNLSVPPRSFQETNKKFPAHHRPSNDLAERLVSNCKYVVRSQKIYPCCYGPCKIFVINLMEQILFVRQKKDFIITIINRVTRVIVIINNESPSHRSCLTC